MFRKNDVLRLICLTLLLSISSLSWGSAFFQAPQSYNAGGWDTQSIAVGDVNRDGKPDLIVASYACSGQACLTKPRGVVGVLLGNGDGTFQAAQTYDSGGYAAVSVAVADVNGDGSLDLVVANLCSDANCMSNAVVGVLFGNGDGTFQATQSYASGGYEANSIAVADVNGDGRPDVLVANSCFTSNNCRSIGGARGAIGVLLSNRDGSLQPVQIYDSGGNKAVSIVIGDINGNSKADLLAVNACSTDGCGPSVVVRLLGNGDGTFQPPVTIGLGGSQSSALAIADVNGDGKLDILAGDYSAVRALLGNGDGTFQSAVNYDTGAEGVQAIAIGDVNGDGKPDVLAASKCEVGYGCFHGVIGVLLGNGDGTFQRPRVFGSYGNDATSMALADINGDSRLDLLVANLCAGGSHCRNVGSAVVFLNKAPIRTTTSLESSLSPSTYGQTVTLTAVVSSAGQVVPTGRVTFKNGGTLLRTVNLSGTTATLSTRTLPAGTLSITATYDGDTQSAKSTSAPLSQLVNQATSVTTITSSVNPSVQGEAVTFSAKVTIPAMTVTGTVTFTAGSTTLGTITLQGGKAVVTTSALPQGSNTITATFDGTANIVGSAASLTQVVK